MKVIHAQEELPKSFSKAIFLAGPSPRSLEVESWRPEALKILEEFGYDGVVFNPESRERKLESNYDNQIDWEEKALNMADCILFWIPRNLETMPALTTNIEFGEWFKSGKIILGAPKDAPRLSYLRKRANNCMVNQSETLIGTIRKALEMVGDGALRSGGECEVPLLIWNTPSFQSWYKAQKDVGNRLDSARVRWNHLTGPDKTIVFLWVLWVSVFIARENRNKINEFIVARPDISSVMLYKKGKDIQSSTVILVREFRSPASNSDAMVWELPGGSSFKPNINPLTLAAKEVFEETDFKIDPERIEKKGVRQLTATLLTHKSHLFSAEISDEELEWFRGQKDIAHGAEGDSERTYPEILTIEEILSDDRMDWSMIGMILSVLTKEFNK